MLNAMSEELALVFAIAVSVIAALDTIVTVVPPLCAFRIISASPFSPS